MGGGDRMGGERFEVLSRIKMKNAQEGEEIDGLVFLILHFCKKTLKIFKNNN